MSPRGPRQGFEDVKAIGTCGGDGFDVRAKGEEGIKSYTEDFGVLL